MVNKEDALHPKPQTAGKNPRAIAKVVTRIIPRPPLEEVTPEEEKSSTPLPVGVSPNNKGLVRASSAPLSSGLTLEKLIEYENLGVSIAPIGVAEAMGAVDESEQEANGKSAFSAEEKAALLDDFFEDGPNKSSHENKEVIKPKGTSEKIEPVQQRQAADSLIEENTREVDTQSQEPPKSLLNIKKPAYQSDLQFVQELAMADPKIVSSLVKDWVRSS
jgi:hypothetical protein